MLVKDKHPSKASSPIEISLESSSNTMLFKDEQ